VEEVPFHVPPCISGLRVFGKGNGEKPAQADYSARRTGNLDFIVSAKSPDTQGFNIFGATMKAIFITTVWLWAILWRISASALW